MTSARKGSQTKQSKTSGRRTRGGGALTVDGINGIVTVNGLPACQGQALAPTDVVTTEQGGSCKLACCDNNAADVVGVSLRPLNRAFVEIFSHTYITAVVAHYPPSVSLRKFMSRGQTLYELETDCGSVLIRE